MLPQLSAAPNTSLSKPMPVVVGLGFSSRYRMKISLNAAVVEPTTKQRPYHRWRI